MMMMRIENENNNDDDGIDDFDAQGHEMPKTINFDFTPAKPSLTLFPIFIFGHFYKKKTCKFGKINSKPYLILIG